MSGCHYEPCTWWDFPAWTWFRYVPALRIHISELLLLRSQLARACAWPLTVDLFFCIQKMHSIPTEKASRISTPYLFSFLLVSRTSGPSLPIFHPRNDELKIFERTLDSDVCRLCFSGLSIFMRAWHTKFICLRFFHERKSGGTAQKTVTICVISTVHIIT